MLIQFYLKKNCLQFYLWIIIIIVIKVFCKFDLKEVIFQNFSLDKGICLTFIKKRKINIYIFISLSKNKI